MGKIFPLGTSDFRRIREHNRIYIDKTRIIELMENTSDFITFLRPRRFGKSLLISTLFYYYDIKSASLFRDLFDDLYIGNHPTEKKNSYYVLRLNFSEVSFISGDSIESSFEKMIINQLRRFIEYYAPKNEAPRILRILDSKDPLSILIINVLNKIALLSNEGKIYVLIDEYDHFTNQMIFSDIQRHGDYKTAVRGSGFIRQFFTTLKALTDGPVKQIFITGILPILLNDMTSGFNISVNVTKNVLYQGSMGFIESEVKNILKSQNVYTEQIFTTIKLYYNGYMFADAHRPKSEKVYNPLMTLSFIQSLCESGNIPMDMLDSTFLSDKNKFDMFIINPQNLKKIIGILESYIYPSNYNQILKIDEILDTDNLTTLLFHFGLLTFHEYTSSEVYYKIPNRAMKELYYDYFKKYLKEDIPHLDDMGEILNVTRKMALEGDLSDFINFMQEKILSTFSFRDSIQLNEKSLKFLFIMFFKFSSFYTIESESELRGSQTKGGFADIILKKNRSEVQNEWMFELKFIKYGSIKSKIKKNNKLKKAEESKKSKRDVILELEIVQNTIEDAKNQLIDYKKIYEKTLSKIDSKYAMMNYAVILFIGKEYIFSEII